MVEVALWKKIEDWCDRNGWEHCYAEYDSSGNLFHIQPGGREWCQGAHYTASEPYNMSGTKRLKWVFREGKGRIINEQDKEVKTWKTYTAIITFKMVDRAEYNRRIKVWPGREPPKLLFQRSIAAHKRCIESGYKKSPFIESEYVDAKDSDKIEVPKDFKEFMLFFYDMLLENIEKWKKEIEE